MKPTSLLAAITLAVALAPATPTQAETERDLIAVLQSDSPKAEKAITCKKLAIYGSEAAVPALAPLLADPELASWARIALEAIPDPRVDAALRDAMTSLQGRLLIGVINSIGVRRDAVAVAPLTKKLSDSNAQVASAAAVALGSIGGKRAERALLGALVTAPADVRSAVAEGCIRCAELFLADGRNVDAVKLYDAVARAEVPEQRHLEGIRGAILARGSAGVPLLVQQLESEDKERVGIGLRTARELPGRNVTETLAAEMRKIRADRRPFLLLAIADRNDAAVLPVVLQAAQSDALDLRITAVKILIDLGDVSSVPILIDAAMDGDPELAAVARDALTRLAGAGVDADLAARLARASGELRRMLIEVAGLRQIDAALPSMTQSLKDDDEGIRGAAIEAVRIIGAEPQAPVLVQMLQQERDAREHDAVRQALLAVCDRSGETCMVHLQPLIKSRQEDLQTTGLHAVAIIGGAEALSTIQNAIQNGEPEVRDEAVRILSTWPNNWPDDERAGRALLALATSADKNSHRILGLRGYLQYIRTSEKMSPNQKVAEVKRMLSLAQRPDDKRQAVMVLGEAPCQNALALLGDLAQDPAVVEEAYAAMVLLASQRIDGVSFAERRAILEKVMRQTKNNDTKRRARQANVGLK